MLSLSVPRGARSLSPAPSRTSPTSLTRTPSDRDSSMRDRVGSISVSPRVIISICPQLTPSQVTLIRKSWRHINTKGLITVLSRCFQRLESSCPVASACFAASSQLSIVPGQVRTVADHAKYLLNMLDRVIDGEQDIDEMREVGARHVCLKQDFGFSSPELDRFQEIFVEVILKQDGIQQSKETCRAWRLLICAMVDVFRDGFDQQLRQFKRKHSFNAHTQYFENMERRQSMCPSRKASLNTDPRVGHIARKLSQL